MSHGNQSYGLILLIKTHSDMVEERQISPDVGQNAKDAFLARKSRSPECTMRKPYGFF